MYGSASDSSLCSVPLDQLLLLAEHIPFPASRQEVVCATHVMEVPPNVIDLLRLFPPDAIFENGADLIARCEELELLLDEERAAPKEYLRSP